MISSLEAFAPWLRSGFRLRIAGDSLNNNRDQWSDLSIILQFLNISSVKLVFMGLGESFQITYHISLTLSSTFLGFIIAASVILHYS